MIDDNPYAALEIGLRNRARLGASGRSAQPAITAPRPSASPVKPAASAPAVRSGFTQADIDRAVTKARAEERARISVVFASSASHGRERVCATLLTSPSNFSGAAIAKELAHMPTDAERERAKRQDRAQASGKVWDQALAAEPANASGSQAADDAWDLVLAEINHSGE